MSAATEPAPPLVSDGAHPNQSITDLFQDSTSPPNVPRPPSSYTPVGQSYSPSGQPTYAASSPPPQSAPVSDGAHPNQSITDLFRDSTSPPNVPHPPSSYTPAGQPYSPSGQ
jgi:hypothetical protein